MNSWLLIFFVSHYVDSISIGSIRNVSFTLENGSSMNIINGTRQQCLCEMMKSSNIAAFNYYSNNTCQFFSNASLTNASYSWTTNVNALFYFLYLPTRAIIVSQDTTVSSTVSTNVYIPTSATSTKTSAVSTTVTVILPSTVAGTGVSGSSMQQLYQPNDIFVTTNGTLYVADYGNSRVQIFWPTNRTAIFSQKGMGQPLSIDIDNASNYYLVEYISTINRISKWSLNQTIFTFTNAYGIAIDSNKNLHISTLDNTIIFWNSTSNKNTTIVSASLGLYKPRHIFLDESNQTLYITDSWNNRIVKFRLGVGNLSVVAGGNGIGIAANQLNTPAGVCVSKRDGTIYVADTYNNRVQKWFANRTVGSTFLGNANGTSGNGIYELNAPYSVVLDPTEQFLYVADSDNHRIQRIAL